MDMKLEYPRLYHQRGKESDIKFILSRMEVIPENLKDEVSREYEKIYTQGGNSARRSANEFLHNTAVKYKSQPKVDVKVKPEPPKQSPEPSKQKMNTMAAIEEEKPRKSFLGGLLDDVDKKYRR